MLCQVGNLGKHYKDWVKVPVHHKLCLFGNAVLEILTITSTVNTKRTKRSRPLKNIKYM